MHELLTLCTYMLLPIVQALPECSCSNVKPLKGFPQFTAGSKDNRPRFDTPQTSLLRDVPWLKSEEYEVSPEVLKALDSCNTHTIFRSSSGNGMHRKVHTAFHLPCISLLNGNCDLMFVEHVTKSFYVDIYEIQRTANLQVYYAEYIDIEKPSYESEDHDILVFASVDKETSTAETDVPWHIRYHRPSEDPYVNLTLPVPDVYIHCSHVAPNSESDCHDSLCHSRVMAPCGDPTQRRLCHWVPVKTVSHATVTFRWPVGISSHKDLVTFTTLTVTSLGTICVIVFAVLYAPKLNSWFESPGIVCSAAWKKCFIGR